MEPRSRKEWLLDVVLFLCAATYGVFISGLVVTDPAMSPGATLFTLDQIIGALACLSLWWCRRWPLQIGIALTVASAFSETSSGAMVVGLFYVAFYLGLRSGAAVFALTLLSALISVSWRIDGSEERWMIFAIGCAVHAAAAGWGVALHQRRALLDALCERAEQAEAQVELRTAQARRENRDEIAREIHDVLGHRLSLLSVHAGALEYRTDPSPDEVRQAVGTIRVNAHEALQDLREVIGVLRAPSLYAPQPSLGDLDELIEQARETGASVTMRIRVDGEPPGVHQRTVYRIIQEGLTNARKHAPGAGIESFV
ncbi:MAG: sensor histidine kinase [Microbacterium sp.]|uniref:sensor histidine kinase n=1 Tax=Microbacterium sp. TaxID=51671 RepID=UPI003F98748D